MDRMGTSGKDSGGMEVPVSLSPGGWGDGSSRLGRAGESQSSNWEKPGQPGLGLWARHNL